VFFFFFFGIINPLPDQLLLQINVPLETLRA